MLILTYLILQLNSFFAIFNRSFLFVFAAILLHLITFLKTSGPDYNDYAYILSSTENMRQNIYGGGVEPIWLIFTLFFDTFDASLPLRFSLIALLSYVIHCLAISIFFKRQKYLFIIGVLIYLANDFIIRDLGQIRNGLASGFFILSMSFLAVSKSKMFLTASILAVCLHNSYLFPYALLMLFHRNYVLASSFIAGLGIALVGQAITTKLELIPLDKIQNRLSDYTTSEIYASPVEGFPIYISIAFVILIANTMLRKRLSLIEMRLFYLYFCAVVTFFAFYQYNILASRLVTTITSLNCIMIPIIIKNTNVNNNYSNMYKVWSSLLVLAGLWYMYNFTKIYEI